MKRIDEPLFIVARAKHHLAEFKWHVQAFALSNPYRAVTEIDSQTGEKPFCFRVLEAPLSLSLIFTDVVHNLNVALERSANAAAGGGEDARFPFAKTPELVRTRFVSGTSKRLPEVVFDVMETFKPYKDADNTLWTIWQMDNAGKHGGLIKVRTRPLTMDEESINLINLQNTAGVAFDTRAAKDDDAAPHLHPASDAYYDMRDARYVIVREMRGILPRQPASILLDRMVRDVEGALEAIRFATAAYWLGRKKHPAA